MKRLWNRNIGYERQASGLRVSTNEQTVENQREVFTAAVEASG